MPKIDKKTNDYEKEMKEMEEEQKNQQEIYEKDQ